MMERKLSAGSPVLREPPPAAAMQIDWAKVAWNNRWLLILGLIAGLGGGYFKFVKATPKFRSSAQVQIVEPNVGNLPIAGIEVTPASQKRSITDEALVMRSERLLRRAAELGELSNQDEFRGFPAESIAAMIAGSPALSIAPPPSSNSNSILEIGYVSTSPETCQAVVQAIVDAYELHLQEQYQNVGQQTIDLIQTARNEVLEKLTTLETEFAEYKDRSGLVFRDGVTTSVHRDNAETILSQKQLLMIEKSRMMSKLEAAKMAYAQKRPLEAVLLALQVTPDSPAQTLAKTASNEEVARLKEINQATVSERMRREQLLPLQLERQELAASVGNDHPAMRTMDTRVRAVEATIKEIAESEEAFRLQLEAAWAKQAEQASEADQPIEPREVLEQQVRIGALALRQQLESLTEEEKLLDEAYKVEVEKARSESEVESKSAKFVREIDRQQQLYNRIMERLDEVNLMADKGGLRLFALNVAKLGYQFEPSLQKSLAIGGFIGLLLAGGLSFLREIADRSYHSAGDIIGHVGLPVIGHVPVLPSKHPEGTQIELALAKLDPRICTASQRKGARSEAFRAIRTALYFNNQASSNQVLQVTSSTPGEGKSTIAANLAVSIAQSGRSVILLDADLRRPRVHNLFGTESAKGVAWAIEQLSKSSTNANLTLSEAILETGIPNLSLMVAGDRPDNPAELLSSSAFEQMLDLLRQKFDMVLIDSPPMLAVSDPSNVVRRADGVLMVVRLRKNAKPLVARACRMLESLEANVLGVVVNGVGSRQARGYGKDGEAGIYYGYGYGYSYGSDLNSYSEYYDDSQPKSATKSKSKRSKPKPAYSATAVGTGTSEEFEPS